MFKNTTHLLAWVVAIGAVVLLSWLMLTFPHGQTSGTSCEFLGSGTVEEIDRSDTELSKAGFEMVVVRLRSNSTTREPKWRVATPTAMAFVKGEQVDLCGYFYQPRPQAAHFIPLVSRRITGKQ